MRYKQQDVKGWGLAILSYAAGGAEGRAVGNVLGGGGGTCEACGKDNNGAIGLFEVIGYAVGA